MAEVLDWVVGTRDWHTGGVWGRVAGNVMISYAVCLFAVLQGISEGTQHRLYTNSMVMNSQNIIRWINLIQWHQRLTLSQPGLRNISALCSLPNSLYNSNINVQAAISIGKIYCTIEHMKIVYSAILRLKECWIFKKHTKQTKNNIQSKVTFLKIPINNTRTRKDVLPVGDAVVDVAWASWAAEAFLATGTKTILLSHRIISWFRMLPLPGGDIIHSFHMECHQWQ